MIWQLQLKIALLPIDFNVNMTSPTHFSGFALQVLQRHSSTTGPSVFRRGHCLCSVRGGCEATQQRLENRLKMNNCADRDWTIQTQLATSVKSKIQTLNRDLWPSGFNPSICVCIVEARSLSHENEPCSLHYIYLRTKTYGACHQFALVSTIVQVSSFSPPCFYSGGCREIVDVCGMKTSTTKYAEVLT